jgi:intracellular septation protein A
MSYSHHLNFHKLRQQILTALLPDLLVSIVAPILIYRLIVPYMSAPMALLFAGIAPVISVGMGLLRHRRLTPLGLLSLLTIALKIFLALALNNTRWMLVSVSLITGAHGVLLLASLLTPRPLLLWLVENTLSRNPAGQQQLRRLLDEAPRSAWVWVTAVWGVALLVECGVNSMLAMTLSVELFLVVSPVVRYGLLGGVLLGTLLFGWIRRRRKQKLLEATSSQLPQEVMHPPLSR